jgi:predicted metal-binding membrane protein
VSAVAGTARPLVAPTPRAAAAAVAWAATLGIAAVASTVAMQRMDGMDMGVETGLGSFASFVPTWIAMMAAMMLPGVLPAVSRAARAAARLAVVPLFVSSYLAVWALVGAAVYVAYRPHGTGVAAALVIAAGLYTLTPFERRCRRRCRESVRSGVEYGRYCIGASSGPMVVLLALGAMSVAWMCVAGALVLAKKLLSPRAVVDVPVAVALVALGVVVAVSPSAIPGLVPAM